MQRPLTSFLWNGEGNIIPAFTDGVRRTVESFRVYAPHPGAYSFERRKSEGGTIIIGFTQPNLGGRLMPRDLVSTALPGMEVPKGDITVYGNSARCVKWLSNVNGVNHNQ